MRKNSPRKWLHAILDLLPVLILPIFALAVRSDNNFQPIEVQAQNYEVISLYHKQSVINGKPNNLNGWYSSDSQIILLYRNESIFIDEQSGFYLCGELDLSLNANDKCIFNINYETNINNSLDLILHNTGTLVEDYPFESEVIVSTSNTFQYLFTNNQPESRYYDELQIYINDDSFLYLKNIEIFNLTSIFGVGNEPTIQEFNEMFSDDYYDYTTSKKVLLNVGTTTLSDTDVGSQMVYTLYKATDKYFNFNNVFNFGQLYDWFVLNIFNGNPTLIFSVVWQIVLYEFIMDLIFLIYALFMFFIDFCTNLIDRFHVKCSGGK